MLSSYEIGQRIKERRVELNLTLQEVADIVGVQNSTIFRYEQGSIMKIKLPVIEAIAGALKVTPGYLLDKPDLSLSGQQQQRLLHTFESACLKENITLGFAIVRSHVSINFFPRLKEQKLHLASLYDILAVARFLAITAEIENIVNPITTYDDLTSYNPTHRIPILGRISAGIPLYAEEQIEGYTYTELNGGAEYFALKVAGDSMNAARINDGDTLIIRRQDYVENNQIAVVIINDDEATVKRFHQHGSQITLVPQSTNPIHQPQIYDATVTNIRVIGLVVKNEISF